MARIRAHNALISCLRHFGLSDPEALCDGHSMSGFLVVITIAVSRRTSHHKCSRPNPNVRQAILRIDALRPRLCRGITREQSSQQSDQEKPHWTNLASASFKLDQPPRLLRTFGRVVSY